MKSNAAKLNLHKSNLFYYFIWLCVLLIEKIYFRASSKGGEYIPREGGFLLTANHQSFIDPPIIASFCPQPIASLARHGLFDIPLLGKIIRNLNAMPVRGDKGDKSSIKTAIELLKSGKSVLIFPEGMRTFDGNLNTGLPGVGLLVHRAKIPVIPCYIDGAYQAYSREMLIPRPKKITVYFGPPIDFSKYFNESGNKQIYKSIVDEIMENIAKLKPAR